MFSKAVTQHEENITEKTFGFKNSPEFAGVCSFINYFGSELGVYLTFPQLANFLTLQECKELKIWETLHVKLLNKLKYRARPDRWEPVLARFLLNNVNRIGNLDSAIDILMNTGQLNSKQSEDASITKFTQHDTRNYCKLSASVRAKALLYLLESQFDRNQGFKDKVNLKSSMELRFTPLGVDVWGRVYWLMKDSEINILIYREDRQQFTLSLICESFDQMRNLAHELRNVCSPEEKLSIILTKVENESAGQEILEQCTTSDDEIRNFLWESLVPPKSILIENASRGLESNISITNKESNCKTTSKDVEDIAPSESNLVNKTEPNEDSIVNSANKVGDDSLTNKISNEDSAEKATEALLSPKENTDLENVNNPNMSSFEPKVQDSFKDECDTTDVTKPKGRSKCSKNDSTIDMSVIPPDVRRSGRQRKPVQVFVVEPTQSKRIKVSKKKPTVDSNTKPLEAADCPAMKSRKKLTRSKASPKTETNGFQEKKKKKKKKRRHGKKGRKSSNPWIHASSSSESDDGDDLFDKALLENLSDHSDNYDLEKITKRQDEWSDLPESDFDPNSLDLDSDLDSTCKGRNLARQKRLQLRLSTDPNSVLTEEPEEPCQICWKTHLPEWLLLCDRCDRGHHAMCLRPPLFIIPEGDWYCPRCQHAALVTALDETAAALESEQKKQVMWKRMQERLNFVNISMTNILCDDDDDEEENEDGTKLGRRRRAKLNAKYAETTSDESKGEDMYSEDESSETDRSDFGEARTGSSQSSGRRKSHRRMPARRAKAQVRSNVRRVRKIKEDDSDVSSECSSSDDESQKIGPRNTRNRQVQYKLDDAFKVLDDALEADEKYQEEKRRRLKRKQQTVGTLEENDSEDNADSDRPAGRSRGKDLSNILGPDWKEFDDDDRPAHPRTKRRSRGAYLSSSSSDDSSGSARPSKRRKDDSDFKPSASECSETDESEKMPTSDLQSVSSSNSWLSTRRHKKAGRSIQRKPVSTFSRKRKRLPRFEEGQEELSDGDRHVVSRARRCARAIISYRESGDESVDSNSESITTSEVTEIKRKIRIHESDSESMERPPPVINRKSKDMDKNNRRRDRLASSSESDYKPPNNASATEPSEETEDEEDLENGIYGKSSMGDSNKQSEKTPNKLVDLPAPPDHGLHSCESAITSQNEVIKSDPSLSDNSSSNFNPVQSSDLSACKLGLPQQTLNPVTKLESTTTVRSFLAIKAEEEEVEDEADECISSRHFKYSISNSLVPNQDEACQSSCLSPDLF